MQPILFLGHGSPMIALEDSPLTQAISEQGRYIEQHYGKPDVILCISAHWFTKGSFTQDELHPKQIYDMYGFPRELYEVTYPVEGSPQIAKKLLELIPSVDIDNSWGIDHGSWTVLKHLFPEADCPVIQLSVNRDLNPVQTLSLGETLSTLSNDNVLIVGSGNIVHNLRAVDWHNDQGTEEARSFDLFIKEAILSSDDDAITKYRDHPAADFSVPTTDHFLPLLYALGAAKGKRARVFNERQLMGSLSMTSYLWE